MLKSEQLLTQTVSFSVGPASGIVLRPGMVIDIADSTKSGTRRHGRIGTGSTTTTIVIDNGDTGSGINELDIDVTKSPTLAVVLSTGLAEKKNIQSLNLNATPPTIVVYDGFSEAPPAQNTWLLETTDVQAQQYRVINVAEGDDGAYSCTALEYNSTIYSAVDTGSDVSFRDISKLSAAPDPVTDIEGEEFLYSDGQGVFVGCDLSWQHNRQRVTEFRVTYRVDDDNWATVSTSSPSISLRQGGNFGALRAGSLQVEIQAYNYLNKGSTIASFTKQLAGKTAAPGDVQNLTMIPTNGLARLQWTQSTDLDVTVGGLVRLRHSPDLAGVTWATAYSIHDDVTGTAKECYCDLKSGTYLAKFVDSGGRLSVGTASVEFTKPDLDNLVNINTQTEDTAFSGSKTNCSVVSNELVTTVTGTAGVYNTTGTYLFQNNPLKIRGFLPGNAYIDSWTGNIDDVTDWDGATPSGADVKLYIRTTQTDPSSSPTWTSWRPFNNAEFSARGYELKAELSTGGRTDAQVAIQQLRVASNMPRRTENNSGTSSASGDLTVTFANAFNAAPAIGISMSTTNSGDYYTIASSSATAFTISIYNSGGTRQARAFTWTATGYGKI